MRLIVQAPLDLGMSVGVTDDALGSLCSSAARERFSHYLGTFISIDRVAPTHELRARVSVPYGTFAHFGEGVLIEARIAQPRPLLLREWISDAQFIAVHGHKERARGHCPRIVHQLAGEIPFETLELHVFSLGIVYLRLVTGELSLDLLPYVFDVFDCFEFAGYHDSRIGEEGQDPGFNLSNHHIKGILNIIAEITCRHNPLADVSRREEVLGELPQFVEVKWFSGCLLMNAAEMHAQSRVISAIGGRVPGELQDAVNFSSQAYYNPRFTVLFPRGSERQYPSRVLYLLKVAEVASLLAQNFESYLMQKMRQHTENAMKGQRPRLFTSKELQSIKYLANIVVSAITLNNITNSVDDLKLLNVLEGEGKLHGRRAAIRDYGESIYVIQSQVIQDHEQKRANVLNNLMAVLTLISMLSVLAGILQVFQAFNFLEGAFSSELRGDAALTLREQIKEMLGEDGVGVRYGEQDPIMPGGKYRHRPTTIDWIDFALLSVGGVIILLMFAGAALVMWRWWFRSR